MKLNTGGEESDAHAISNGISIVHLPITFADMTFGKPSAGVLDKAVAAIDTQGTFIHCQHGKDRTGLAIGACWVKRQGWTKDAAYREMLTHQFHPVLRGLCWAWKEDVPCELETDGQGPPARD